MNLREHAARILTRVLNDSQSLTTALEHELPKIAETDKAFVQALCYGVIRQYFRLDSLLQQLLQKPLKAKDADIKALMLLGLYQLQHMRVKPHAAVSETVAATRHKPWAKSLVNAILRNFLRHSESLLAKVDENPQARANHPSWMIEQIQQDWPAQAEDIFAANDQNPPLTLRVNLRKTNRDAYLQQLAAQGLDAQAPAGCDSAIILAQAVAVTQLPGFAEGLVSVQDLAAQLAADLLDAQPGQRVLDLCAAPGGKTAAILERQPQLAALLAVDVDAQRLQRVSDNLSRLQLAADLLLADATQSEGFAHLPAFDRILLDAPCSGLGVIRRHPDIKLLRRASDIANLQAVQAKILDNAWPLLAPGGVLLYATCSILKAENETQIAAFLGRHPDAIEIPITADWGQARVHGRQILNGEQQMDGFYYAKLRKQP